MTQIDKTQSLTRAVSLLDCFSGEHPELGVREASRLVNLSSSTTGRLLSHLKDLGVLSQNPVTHAYSLGARILVWSGVYTTNLDVRNKALPAMHELHHETQETISLYVLEGNERVCIERIESTQNVRIIARVGRRLPLYAGSAGKVFLAFLSAERRDEILASSPLVPFTHYTIVDKEVMLAELAKIHHDGYAVSHGEWTADASGVAAPIFDLNGEIIAALTISGPTQRFNEEAISHYTKEISRAAKTISHDMGYTQ